MKGFDVLKVKSAVKTRSNMDLSRTHLTTMDFGEIVPLFAEETVPGDKFDISANYFSRMAPLVKPTYGKFSFKTVAAFVPYYMVAEDVDAWLAGKTTWEGITPIFRHITVGDLVTYTLNYCITTAGATSQNADFTWVTNAGVYMHAIFTKTGKYYWKVLNSLGYALPQGVDLQSASTWSTTVKDTKLSAYPLLAYFKLYNDYMSQSQRFNTSVLSNFLNNLKFNKTATGYNTSTGAINHLGLNVLFSNLFLNYENDYFVSAWQSPNTPLASPESITSAQVPYGVGSPAVGSSTYDNYIAQNGGSTITLGQRSLDFLKSFDDWVRRNNYSGSRSVQQIYSRFGIKTDDYRTHYAQVISTDESPIQIGDVTSTAGFPQGSGATLGDYAGKGIMSDGKSINVSVSDYGLVLILGYYTVAPMYAYGFDKKVLRNSPLDYYNPEFDGIGAEAISLGEVYANPISTSADTTLDTQVFGFTERYNSYRYGRDVITGEFRNYHPDGDMNCWHTGRNLNAIREAGNLVAQSSAVNTLPQSDSEYNRIFSIPGGDVNHFYMTARFNVKAQRPMLNLNQVPRLGVGDTTVSRNGNVIS